MLVPNFAIKESNSCADPLNLAISSASLKEVGGGVAEDALLQAVPCGLLEKGTVTQAIKKGELLTYANTAVDATSKIVEFRKRQDALVYGK